MNHGGDGWDWMGLDGIEWEIPYTIPRLLKLFISSIVMLYFRSPSSILFQLHSVP